MTFLYSIRTSIYHMWSHTVCLKTINIHGELILSIDEPSVHRMVNTLCQFIVVYSNSSPLQPYFNQICYTKDIVINSTLLFRLVVFLLLIFVILYFFFAFIVFLQVVFLQVVCTTYKYNLEEL